MPCHVTSTDRALSPGRMSLWHLKHLLKIPTSSNRTLCPCTGVVIASPVTADSCPGARPEFIGCNGHPG